MDLMEILKGLFGEEAMKFEQFAEKVNNAADVKLGNLAGGQYIEKDRFDDVFRQLETENASLAYGYRNFKRFRNRILHMFSHQTQKQAIA